MNAKIVDVDTENGYSVSEVEKFLKRCRPIKVAGVSNRKLSKNLQQEILKTLDQNYESHTEYLDGLKQTGAKRRSSGDIFRLLYQMDNTIKFHSVLNALGELVKNNAIATYNCCTIYKRVFHFPTDKLLENTSCRITGDGENHDEFGWYWPAQKENYRLGGYKIDRMKLELNNFK